MNGENEITFVVFYEGKESILQFREYDTVGDVKDNILKEFGILNSNIHISGWKISPNDDRNVLKMCCDIENVNFLYISKNELDYGSTMRQSGKEDLELEVCQNFITEIPSNIFGRVRTFHEDLLKNKIAEVCLGPKEQRKVLLLYLHNKDDDFSTIFWRNLMRPEVTEILNRNYSIIGWDLNETKYHDALIDSLFNNQLGQISPYVETKIGSATLIVTFEINGAEVVNIFSCMTKRVSDEIFLTNLKNAAECQVKMDNVGEEMENEKIIINSEFIQQNFANLLGNRDYDSYEYDEHEHLEKNIAFAMVGPPTAENGYSDTVKNMVQKLFKKILEKSNTVAQYKDKVEIAVIYICTEPLLKQENGPVQSTSESNSEETIYPYYPVFVVRKCQECENPCRIFIDHMGRVYSTWLDFLTNNKLPECRMVVPKDGRYDVDDDGKVILETYFSPACNMGTKILNGLDIASSVTGLASGTIGVACALSSVIAALPVAPVAIAGGAIAGGYSLLRSGMMIRDKVVREESMDFFESAEARAAYLNIVAGGLGFVGAGANALLAQYVAQGANIGAGARVAVNAINVINLGAGGVGVANAIHDVYHQYIYNDETPSALTILQLTSNVLFFGHAVFSFRSAATIIDETQTRVLKDYTDSLRSNRHRKTFRKVMKQTIRQNEGNSVQGKAEVISSLKNINNKDETFAALTRNMKKLNKKGIKVFAKDNEIQFNGVTIDMNEFCSLRGKEVNNFLSNLPIKNTVTPAEFSSVKNLFNSCHKTELSDACDLVMFATKFISYYDLSIQEKIILAFSELLDNLTQPALRELADVVQTNNLYYELFQRVMDFFSQMAKNLEDQYKRWKFTGAEEDYNSLFDFVDMEDAARYIKFMQSSVDICFELKDMKRHAIEKLVKFVWEWVAQKYSDTEEEKEREKKRITHSTSEGFVSIRESCDVCKGYFYQNVK